MKKGDLVLYYHSVEAPVGVVGIVKVIKEYYPDPTQFNPSSDYFDPKSPPEKPRWYCPDFGFVKKLSRIVTLEELKKNARLKDMALLQKGSRLSVHSVTKLQYDTILSLVE